MRTVVSDVRERWGVWRRRQGGEAPGTLPWRRTTEAAEDVRRAQGPVRCADIIRGQHGDPS